MNTKPFKNTRFLLAASCLATANLVFAQAIDTSSEEAYEQSMKALGDSISEDEELCFQKGFINLMLTANPEAEGKSTNQQLQLLGEAEGSIPTYMDGITKDEIIARGKEVSDCEQNGTSETVAEEVSDPQTPQEALKACVAEHVAISNVQIEKGIMGEDITVTLTNNLSWPISGVRIRYTIASPERTIPWVKSDTSRSISGGIEVGESRELKFSSDIFSGNIPPEINRSDLVVEAIVIDVADANGDQLVHDINVIGDGWSGETSTQQCE